MSSEQPAPSAPARRLFTYRFDRFELVPHAEQLRKQGVLIHLPPQPFRLLLMLIMRAGDVVTREEIQQELWGSDTYVDFNQSINAAIRRIRFALNDTAETPRFLETLPRRGYCFLAPVERVEIPPAMEPIVPVAPESQEPESSSVESESSTPRTFSATHLLPVRAAMATALLVLSLWTARGPGIRAPSKPNVLRIAIAPVELRTGAAEFDARGLEAELRARIAQVQPERIAVVDPHATADLRIETSVGKTSERFFVDARMIDVASSRHVWRDTFRRSQETQDLPLEVAVRLTRAVIERSLPRRTWQPRLRTKVSARALAAYEEGRALQSPAIPVASRDRALAAYERALSIEPRFAEAWAAIAGIWVVRAMAWTGESRKTAIPKAYEAVNKALALDPHCAAALNAQAVLLMLFDRSYDAAGAAARKAVAEDPAYLEARLNLAQIYSATGHHAEALAELDRARMLDPHAMVPSPANALLYLMARRYGDALAEYRAIQVIAPQRPGLHWDLMSAAMGAQRWEDAALSLSAIAGERVALSDVADPGAEFRRHLRRLAPVLAAKESQGVDPYAIAWLHAQAGNADAAFAAFDRASENPAHYTMYTYIDPRFDPIRTDPRFITYLEKFGLLRGPSPGRAH